MCLLKYWYKTIYNKICTYNSQSKTYFLMYIAIPEKRIICFTAAFAPVQTNDVVWMHKGVTVKRVRKWK